MSGPFLLFPTADTSRAIDAWRWIREQHPGEAIEVVIPDGAGSLRSVPVTDESEVGGHCWRPGDLGMGAALRGGRLLAQRSPRGTLHLYPDVGGRHCLGPDLAALRIGADTAVLHDGNYRPFGVASLLPAILRRTLLHRFVLAGELSFTIASELLCVGLLPIAWVAGRFASALRQLRSRRGGPLRVTFLAFYPPSAAGARYRAHTWARVLDEDPDLRCRVLGPASSDFHRSTFGRGTPEGRFAYTVAVFLRRLWHLVRVATDDTVVLRLGALPYHPYGGPALERLLRVLGPRFIYDIDDAIHLYYQPPATGNPLLRTAYRCLHTPDRVGRVMAMSDGVIAGNPTLAEFAHRSGAHAVHRVPTCVDIERYGPRNPEGREPLTIGWVGTAWNLRHLDVAATALARVAERHPFRLLVVSSEFRALPGVPVENRPWTLAGEIADLLEMDIGLMPLEPGDEPEAKCGFKALQYMACGIPAIVSPVGVNAEIVRHRENGWHATTDLEWEAALEEALSDVDRRETFGRAARHAVDTSFTFHAHRARMRAIISGEEVTDFQP